MDVSLNNLSNKGMLLVLEPEDSYIKSKELEISSLNFDKCRNYLVKIRLLVFLLLHNLEVFSGYIFGVMSTWDVAFWVIFWGTRSAAANTLNIYLLIAAI